MPTKQKLLTYQIDSAMDDQTVIRQVAYSVNGGEVQTQRFQQRIGAPTPITIEAPEDAIVRGTILDLDDRDNPAESATPFEGVWADLKGPQPAGAVTLRCVKERFVDVPDPEPVPPSEPPADPVEPPIDPATPTDPTPEPESVPEPIPEPESPPAE